MSTISEHTSDDTCRKSHAKGPWGPALVGAAGVAITAGWVLFLFFAVPALMK